MNQTGIRRATAPIALLVGRLLKIDLSWFVIVGAPVMYWLHARLFNGPVFLTDEIGYLSNAAFLAGFRLDAASNYHAGYSIFLTPLFRALDTPEAIWQGVIVVNCILLGLAFLGLSQLLRRWFPDVSPRLRVAALLLSAAYPAWLTMAGYAFPSCAFLAVFIWSVVSLDRWMPERPATILPHAFLAGYLYWVHPTGLATVFASSVLVLWVALKRRSYVSAILHLVIAWGMVILYAGVIGPWLLLSMTPPGLEPLVHYPSVSGAILGLQESGALFKFVLLGLGQISYLIVGTFGLALAGVWFCVRRDWTERPSPARAPFPAALSGMYVLGSAAAIIGMGALEFSGGLATRVDHQIYGRYVDPVALPLLAAGYLSIAGLRRRASVISAAGVAIGLVAVGAALEAVYGALGAHALLNTPGFWPQYLFPSAAFPWWMVLGALGIFAIAAAGRRAAVGLMLAAFVMGASRQAAFHHWAARETASLSMVQVIRSNLPRGACIASDPLNRLPGDFPTLRFQLYKFYFFDYRYSRMSRAEWLASCDGPLLTRSLDGLEEDSRVRILARDYHSGIFLVVKATSPAYVFPADALNANDLYVVKAGRRTCLLSGCFSGESGQLIQYSEVGTLTEAGLTTTGKAGFLFFGPYYTLAQGDYYLVLQGDVELVEQAKLDVVSDGGATVHAEFDLCTYGQGTDAEIVLPFRLDADTAGLEVRLQVGAGDKLVVRGYEILAAQDKRLQTSSSGLCYFGDGLTQLGHEVGALQASGLLSDARFGFLVFGPGATLSPGKYHLKVYGSTGPTPTAYVDVVHDQGRTELLRLAVQSGVAAEAGLIAEGVVTISESVTDLEVRLHVEADDVVRLAGYQFTPVDP